MLFFAPMPHLSQAAVVGRYTISVAFMLLLHLIVLFFLFFFERKINKMVNYMPTAGVYLEVIRTLAAQIKQRMKIFVCGFTFLCHKQLKAVLWQSAWSVKFMRCLIEIPQRIVWKSIHVLTGSLCVVLCHSQTTHLFSSNQTNSNHALWLKRRKKWSYAQEHDSLYDRTPQEK